MKRIHLTVIIVLLALGGGILVWHDMRNAREEVMQKPAEQQSLPKEVGQTQDLVWYQIPELGIEFQVKKEMVDELIYKYEPHAKVDFGGAAFSTKKLSRVPGCEQGGSFSITKLEGAPENYFGNPYGREEELRRFHGFFIHLFSGTKATCALQGHENEFSTVFSEEYRKLNEEWFPLILATMKEIEPQRAFSREWERNLVWYRIPELGIGFQVEKIVASDLIYKYVPGSDEKGSLGGVSFSTEELSRIPGCKAGGLVSLSGLKGVPEDYDESAYLRARNPKQFDGFFVIVVGPQAPCASLGHGNELNDFFLKNPQFNGWDSGMLESIREIN